jgi:hypothetical protein
MADARPRTRPNAHTHGQPDRGTSNRRTQQHTRRRSTVTQHESGLASLSELYADPRLCCVLSYVVPLATLTPCGNHTICGQVRIPIVPYGNQDLVPHSLLCVGLAVRVRPRRGRSHHHASIAWDRHSRSRRGMLFSLGCVPGVSGHSSGSFSSTSLRALACESATLSGPK